MSALGIRCSNTDFSYAVLQGKKQSPVVLDYGTTAFPKGYSTPFKLKWFLQELDDIIKKYPINSITLKGTEGLAARDKAFVERVECEAVVFLIGATLGIKRVQRKLKSSIAKDLGLKGRSHYLATQLDTSVIANFDKLSTKVQEAILVGWSELS